MRDDSLVPRKVVGLAMHRQRRCTAKAMWAYRTSHSDLTSARDRSVGGSIGGPGRHRFSILVEDL